MSLINNHDTPSPSPIGNIASLRDKIALITGASSGLGRAIAEAYASAGAYIVCADLRPEPATSPTIAGIHKDVDLQTPTVDLINRKYPAEEGKGERASFVKCDVREESSVQGVVKFAVERYGRLDIMVNNAGKGCVVPFCRFLLSLSLF